MKSKERLEKYGIPTLRRQVKEMETVTLLKSPMLHGEYQRVMLHKAWSKTFVDAYYATCRWLNEYPADVQTYNVRKIAGTELWSAHAWALAADVFGQPHGPGETDPKTGRPLMSESWYKAMAKNGIEWGGGWRKPDLHHLEWSR